MDLSTFNTKFRHFLIEELKGKFSTEKLESLSVVFEDLVKDSWSQVYYKSRGFSLEQR